MIHTLNRRADSHQNLCEDALYYTERDGWIIAAVFDGCSDGINSHFASWLMHYTLRAVLKDTWNHLFQLINRTDVTAPYALSHICANMRMYLETEMENLALEGLEVLSTIVIALYHPRSQYLAVKFIGDGLLLVNGGSSTSNLVRITSGPENKPTYLSYIHPAEDIVQKMEDEYPAHVFTNVTEWSICTDGIDQIKGVEDPLGTLLRDKYLFTSDVMLGRKINIMQQKGAVLGDDVTIIRYTNETI